MNMNTYSSELVEIPAPGSRTVDSQLTDADALSLEKTMGAAVSENTKANYRSARKFYKVWLKTRPLYKDALNVKVVCAYLSYLGDCGKSISTVQTARSAILFYAGGRRNELAQHPGVRKTIQGIIKQARGKSVLKQARSLSRLEIKRMVAVCDQDDAPRGKRDRALLLAGLALGVRANSELAQIRLSDLHPTEQGISCTIRCSKTLDYAVNIPIIISTGILNPVAALNDYIACLKELGTDTSPESFLLRSVHRGGRLVSDGKIALSAESITKILQRLVTASGGDAAGVSSHSLRSSYATHSLESYSSISVAKNRWANTNLLSRYDRKAEWDSVSVSSGWLAG